MAIPKFEDTEAIDTVPSFEDTTPVTAQQSSFTKDSVVDEQPTFDSTMPITEAISDPITSQLLDAPRAALYGAVDAGLGIVEGAERGFEQIGRKFEESNRKNYNELINRGEDPESWKARAFNSLADMHKGVADWWGGASGADLTAERRRWVDEHMGPMTEGFVTDVARGIGGMATLPLDVSAAGILTIPGQMFDEGYQQSTGTEEERLDKATAYAFMASPVEAIGDVMLKKFGGKATRRGATAILKQAAKKLGLNFVSEGSTETLQDGILNKINGKRMFDENSMRTFLVSGTVGTIVSGAHVVNNEVKSSRTRGQLETMGMNEEDVNSTMELIAKGKVDEAIAFVNEKKGLKLTDIIESSQQATAENHPIDEKRAAQLEALVNKDTLTEDELDDVAILQMELDADDQAIIDDALNGVEGADVEFNKLIARLKNEPVQEVQDDTERKPEVGTEQEGKPGQEPVAAPEADGTATEQDTGAPEAQVGSVGGKPITVGAEQTKDGRWIPIASRPYIASDASVSAMSGNMGISNESFATREEAIEAGKKGTVDWYRDQATEARRLAEAQRSKLGDTDSADINDARADKFDAIADKVEQNIAQKPTPEQAGAPEAGVGQKVYHGTSSQNGVKNEFSLDVNHATLGGFSKHGFSFGDEKTAGRYAKDFHGEDGVVREYYINPNATLKLNATDFESLQSIVSKIDNGEKLSVGEEIKLEIISEQIGVDITKNTMDVIKNNYDSIEKSKGRGGAEAEFLVLDPSIINPAQKPTPAEPGAKETLTPISQVEDTPVVDPMKDVYPPNPQLPEAQWRKEMLDFAVKNVQAGVSRSQFVSEMESELHKNVSVEELGDIWRQAQRDAKRIAQAVKQAERTSAKAKVTQGQFKDTETETVKSSTIIKELFRVQQRASRQGRKAGIKEIKELIKQKKIDAQELQKNFREQLKGLKGATQSERDKLRIAFMKIKTDATPEANEKAFDSAISLLDETMSSVIERNSWEYVPFPKPENEFGVDKNSAFSDIRKVYLENGGREHDQRVGRKSATAGEMIGFLTGNTSTQSDANLQGAVEGLEQQRESARKDKVLSNYNRASNKLSWLHNLDDMMKKISVFDKTGTIDKLNKNLAAGRVVQGSIKDKLTKMAKDLDIYGDFERILYTGGFLSGAKRVGTGTKIQRKYRISINGTTLDLTGTELFNIYLQLRAADNREALVKNGKLILKRGGKFIKFKDITLLESAVNKTISDADMTGTFDSLVGKWQKMTDESGKLNKERYDSIQKNRGVEDRLTLVDGIYTPIAVAGNDMNMDDILESVEQDGVKVNLNNAAFNMIHRSYLKERIGRGKGFVVVDDSLSTLARIIDNTAEFYGAGEQVMEMARTLNNKTLTDAIMDVYGNDFVRNMNAKLHQLQGTQQIKDKSTVGSWIDKPLKGLVRKATQLRLIAVTTQMKMRGSMYLAMSYLNNPKTSLAFSELNLGNKFLKEQALRNGLIKTRWTTEMFSPELMFGQNSKSILNDLKGDKTRYERFRNWSKSWGDKSAIMGIYRMVAYDAMIEQGLGKTVTDMKKLDQEFFDAVGNKVAGIVGLSQPSGYAEHLSVLKSVGRHNTAAMLVTLYGSQASRLAGNMDMATADYLNKRDSGSLKKLGRTALYFGLINSMYMSLVVFGGRLSKDLSKALWGKLNGDEDDDELVDNIAEDLKRIPKDTLLNIAKMSEVTDEAIEVAGGLLNPRYGKEQPLDAFAGRELQAVWDMGAESVKLAAMIKNYNNNVYKSTKDGETTLRPIRSRSKRKTELARIERQVKKVTDSTLYGVGFLRDIPTRYLEPLELGDLAGKVVGKKIK